MKATALDLRTQTIHLALQEIAEANGGFLRNEKIVEAASDPNHVLHCEFTWDDAEAGNEYRIIQAGALVRRVKYTIMRSSENEDGKVVEFRPTRVYQSRPSARNKAGGYETMEEIANDSRKYSEMMAQVMKELSAYRKRYQGIAELGRVWDAIAEVVPE